VRTYIFRIYLMRNKKIYREIEVFENTNLYKLAETIIDAYNFNFDHCFGFFSKISESRYFDSEKKYELFTDLIEEGENLESTGAKSVKKTKVKDVWQKFGDKMMFLFDYGDSWQFIVDLKDFSRKKAGIKYPKILLKVGRPPKQY